MRTCLLLCALLAGVLAAPNPELYGKKTPLDSKNLSLEYRKPPAGKKPAPAGKKPAPGEGRGTGEPSISPRQSDVLGCGSHVIAEGSSYVIQSPNYPDPYPNNADCSYDLTTSSEKDVTLTCTAFNVESHSSCAWDWLEVNGVKFCGSSMPPPQSDSELTIEFQSDYSVVLPGYQCSVTLTEPTILPVGSTLTCGSSRLGRGQYTITDGSGDYSNNVDCVYLLRTLKDDDQISVTCSSFNVESHSRCSYDWLAVNSVKFCSSSGPDGEASRSEMTIDWHTDYSVVRPGFACDVDVAEPPPPTTPGPTTQPPPPPPTVSPQACACGTVNRAVRIVGGSETEVNEYPWQAGIVSTNSTRTWCGGTVINSLNVLTAAHCTSGTLPANIQVLVREHAIGVSDGEIRVNVLTITQHPNYNSNSLSNDFSLLKLATALTFSNDNRLAPACLPSIGNNFEGADAVVTGWGTTSSGSSQADALREVTVPIISNTACSAAYSSIDSTMVCAGLDAGGKDSCQGDSGGPLVSLEGGKYSLAGVVSWGVGCASPGYPGVYARVTSALSWIEANIADGQYCAN